MDYKLANIFKFINEVITGPSRAEEAHLDFYRLCVDVCVKMSVCVVVVFSHKCQTLKQSK